MPNSIIRHVKQLYPQYRDIPDDELTLRYAKIEPEYLKNQDFKADYDRITRKPELVAPTPKERAGAFESIGRRAAGGLQGGLGGPLWKGVELGARLLGADDLAQYSKEVSAEAREYDRQQRLKSANTGFAGFLGDVAGAAPSLLPILPAVAAAPLVGLARMTAAGIAAGATGGLSTFSDAEKAYYDKYKSEGMSDSEAESAARKSAAIPSIASGIATGTITRFMPVGGVESVSGLFGKGAAASAVGRAAGAEAGKRAVAAGLTEAGVAASIKAGVARQVGLAEARALVATSIPKAFIKGATNEAIEEGIDQIAQSAIQKLSYDPELTLKQAIDNVINAAMVGGALGGSIQAAVQPSARKGAEAAIRQDKIYNELRVQAEAEAKSDATRREDRLEDEMRREKELKALDRTAAANLEATYAAQQKQRDAQVLADKTLIDTLNEKKRIEAEAKLTASQQSAVTAIRDLAAKESGGLTDAGIDNSPPLSSKQSLDTAGLKNPTPPPAPPTPPASTVATAQKMPWEMTRADYSAQIKAEYGRQGFPDLAAKQATDATHAKEVAQAIREGKIQSHPDYPDLKPTPAATGKKAPIVLWGRQESKGQGWIRLSNNTSNAEMKRWEKDGWEVLRYPQDSNPEIKPTPAPTATGATGQQGGVVFDQEMFQGRGATPEAVYGPEAVAQGRAVPILGPGSYYAFTNSDAKAFGKVSKGRVQLRNPLVIDSSRKWAELLAAANASHLDSGGQMFYREPQGIAPATLRLKAYVQAQGHDGIVIKDTKLDQNKRLRESFGHDQVVSYASTTSPPAETEAKTEPAYISPEELMARQPKAIPSETVARIEAEEKAAQAQADIKAVTDRILVMIGRKVLPKNVKVVYQPESNFAGYYQSGEIIINAARIVNVEGVLVEEAVHAVWADPELQAAWDTVKKTVTIQDIDEQRLRAAADKRYPDNAELREEAAVAKLVRHRTPAIKGFLMAIRRAVAKAFGFHVKLSDIELIQNAAMSKLTADSKAVQISPPAATGAAAKKMPWEMTFPQWMNKGERQIQLSRPEVAQPTRQPSVKINVETLDGGKTVSATPYLLPGYKGPTLVVVEYKSPKGRPQEKGYRVYAKDSGVLIEDSNGVATLNDTLKLSVQRISNAASKSNQTAFQVVHRQVAQRALREGKPVPESVLADYPDLKPAPPAATGAAQKMPWEMTKDEYHDHLLETDPSFAKAQWENRKQAQRTDESLGNVGRNKRGGADREHRASVEQALREGKPVPESVLADYPDLKPTPPDAPRYAAAERDADSRYLELAKEPEKNRGILQRMVDAAAKAAGYDGGFYHGTIRRRFEVFDVEANTRNDFGRFGRGIYFTKDKRVAAIYAGKNPFSGGDFDIPHGATIYSVYLKLRNPKVVDARDVTMPETKKEAQEVTRNLTRAGHDGVIGTVAGKIDSPNTEYVVFDPSQIKSADPITRDDQGNVIPLSERFNPESPDIRYAAAERGASDQPAFYSRLNRAVEQTTQNKASGAQWKATIKNSKLGTNADEYALVGVGDLEDGKTYTKQEVLDYLRANEVVVKDVTLGEKKPEYDTGKAMRRAELESIGSRDLTRAEMEELSELNAWLKQVREDRTRDTRFSTHQLPGAVEGSYREVLLTVPDVPNAKKFEPSKVDVRQTTRSVTQGSTSIWYDGKRFADYGDDPKLQSDGSYQQRSKDYWLGVAKELFEKGDERNSIGQLGDGWRDGHELYSSFANPIVRGRTNERLIPIESLRESNPDVYARVKADGRTHALMVFVEENQLPLGTRWHEVNGVKFEGGGSFERASAYAKEHGGTVEKKYSGELAKMPALFRDNGYAIGLKYGLRYAVERNADLYGWTTGEQQAARYNLSKHVKSVTWNEGNKEFSAVPISDGDTIARSGVEAVDLSGIVGKDVAQKLIEATANRFGNRRLEGLDLKIGGEGLKKLYDVDFRNIINNLPAVKKSGQKVGTANIPDADAFTTESYADFRGRTGYSQEQAQASYMAERLSGLGVNGIPIHSLAITPAIRDAVMGGQARFAASERGAGSELGALQGSVDGVDYLNWADRFRTNFITKYAPITKMERVLRESAGMGRAEFGMERWFERLAGVAGIAKASIIEMRMELDPLVAGDEKAFNNYIFWQYIERRSTLRAQALADVASARAMVANGTATDADRASIASNNKLADQMEFAGYDNPTVAKKNLDSIRANLAKSGALEDMDKAVAIYVKHTNLALDNIVDSGYLAQDRIDKYRSQFPVYIPIINLQIPDSKNGYQVTKGRVGISDPNFKSKNPLDAFDEYIFRMHAKAEVNKAKRRIYNLAVKSNRPDIARVEHDRLHSTESGFSLRVNGVDTMVVAHPEVVAAVNSFSDTASNTLNDFLRKANSVLKFGATSASLAFQVRNLFLGDLPTLALMSKAGITNPINAVTFVIDVITSFAHNFRASAYGEYSPLMLEFMKSGAMGSSMHSAIDSLDRDTRTGTSSEGKISQYIIDAFGKMSNTIEQTSKLAGFKRLMDKAGVTTLAELNDPIKQMALVAEVRNYCGSPDFARNGSVMGLAMIRLGFVFVNPAMAGNASALERLTANLNKNSSGSEKKAALTAQVRLGFTVGLATMISYALRSQDDEAEESYDGLDKKSKEDNFHLITDKYDVDIEGNKVRRFVKIPKRGVIKIVANTMEAYLDYSRAKDPEDFTRMMGRVLEEVIPLDIKGDTLEERIQGAMASVNPAIRVPIEYATGMSFYSRQPTVPRSMRGAANSEQYRERTNENIKVLAGVFGVSPLKFKQALESATGGLTRTLLPEKESELNVDSPINIPIVKGYFSPTYRESADADTIDRLFMEAANVSVDRMRKATQFVDSREGMDVEAIYREAIDKLGVQNRDVVEKVRELLILKRSGVTKEERRITQLPPKQRAELIIRRHARTKPQDRDNLIRSLINKRVITRDTAMYMEAAGFKYKW